MPFWRPRGCVLWLDFLEPKGGTAYDKSGYDNHGTIYGAVRERALGRYGLSSDGVDDYVRVPYSAQLALEDEFTVEVITKIIDWKTTYPVVFQRFRNYMLQYGSKAARVITGFLHDGTAWRGTGAVSIEPNVFNHFTLVWKWLDGEGIFTLYKDGEFGSSRTYTTKPDIAPGDLFILTNAGLVYWHYGITSFLRVYNRALSEREIRANYAYFLSRIKRAV